MFQGILAAMGKEGVRLVNESQLSANQKSAALEYFQNQVRPRLVPIMLDQKEAKPRMRDPFLYLAILISGRGAEAAKKKHALIEVPTDTLSRFFILPGPGDRRDIMLLEDVIRLGLPQIFSTLRPGKIEAWTVKVKIEWCGICGTDLHEYLDGPIFAPPAGSPHPAPSG